MAQPERKVPKNEPPLVSIGDRLAGLDLGDFGSTPEITILPVVDPTSFDSPYEQLGQNVTELDFAANALPTVKAKIFDGCTEEGIDINGMHPDKIIKLAGIAGKAIVSHVLERRSAYQHDFPDTNIQGVQIVVPGSIGSGLKQILPLVDSTRSSSPTIRRRALKEMFALTDFAQKAGSNYPEVTIARDLESEWLSEDHDTAAESISALLASYGQRLRSFRRANGQRNAAIINERGGNLIKTPQQNGKDL